MTAVPYTVERRPDTGVNNVTMGIWLFLASETMLFGGLFSSYVLLRAGDPQWGRHAEALHTSWGLANTVLTIAAAAALSGASRAFRNGRAATGRWLLHGSALSAAAFVVVKSIEYSAIAGDGLGPAHSTFLAVYCLLTGVHLAHVAGGLAVTLHLATTGFRMSRTEPARFSNRVTASALYWYFVDAVWITIFVALYIVQ
jgi:heme/copper-type cytochrome/quinol oxidase subunit 3